MVSRTTHEMATLRQCKSVNDLPDEILQHILFFVPPLDVVSNIQRISKRFSSLSCQPLLWRHHCRTGFKYWDPKHRIRQNFLAGVGEIDWRGKYIHRTRIDWEITRVLDAILEGQVDRIQKFQLIGDFGYDAKDTLLRHCHADEEAKDVLARRQAEHTCLYHVISTNIDTDIMRMLLSTTFIEQRLWRNGRSF